MVMAPSSQAAASGKAIAKKREFSSLCISGDKTLVFGEVPGSGKDPYSCSMDFAGQTGPVPRCNCPSRQNPCKHVLGLLYAYVQGQSFTEAEIPQDILEKREAAAKRLINKEQKKTAATGAAKKPTKAKIESTKKKINMQQSGLDTAQTLLKNIVRTGLAGIDDQMQATITEQIKGLGNFHIKGIQVAFNDLMLGLQKQEEGHAKSIESIIYLHALLKKAREHLDEKLTDEDKLMKLDTDTEIEEHIGHVWKTEELHANGCFIGNADIVQLSFNVADDLAKKEFVETGYFICLQNGRIYTKKNFRPFKAAKHIARDDTVFEQVHVEELFVYPGGMNSRIRYEKFTTGPIPPETYAAIKNHASESFTETAKAVKDQIKSPLSSKNPVALLKISAMYLVEGESGRFVLIEDASGGGQLLSGETIDSLCLVDFGLLVGQAILVMYENSKETGLLTGRPLSIVADDRIIRLEF